MFNIQINANTLLDNINEEKEENLNILAERILRKRGKIPLGEYFTAHDWTTIINEYIPEVIDEKALIEIIYKIVRAKMIKELKGD